MLENQFINFREDIDPMDSSIAIPVTNEDTFFIPRAKGYTDAQAYVERWAIVTLDGKTHLTNSVLAYDCFFEDQIPQRDAAFAKMVIENIAPLESFRIKVYTTPRNDPDEILQIRYSNKLCLIDSDMSTIRYRCNEDTFGFPFRLSVEKKYGAQDSYKSYIQASIPIILNKPQFKQEDKVYTKRNGEQVVLSSSITKEYEGHTDYLPLDWHTKILIALSCDEVYINGERVTKTGTYDIDHDKTTYTDCGTKLLRATFKVTTNVTQRNSNY